MPEDISFFSIVSSVNSCSFFPIEQNLRWQSKCCWREWSWGQCRPGAADSDPSQQHWTFYNTWKTLYGQMYCKQCPLSRNIENCIHWNMGECVIAKQVYFLFDVLIMTHRSDGSTDTLNTSLGYGRLRILHWKLVFVSLRVNTGYGDRESVNFYKYGTLRWTDKSIQWDWFNDQSLKLEPQEVLENSHWKSFLWSPQAQVEHQVLS